MSLSHSGEERRLAHKLKTPAALESYEKLIVGLQIKRARKRMKINQRELASKLKTTQSVIARIETGRQNISLGMLVKIASHLGKKIKITFQ